jgi:hypothetical protein
LTHGGCAERHSESHHISKAEEVNNADILDARCERNGISENDCYTCLGQRNQRIEMMSSEKEKLRGKQIWNANGNQNFRKITIELGDAPRSPIANVLR